MGFVLIVLNSCAENLFYNADNNSNLIPNFGSDSTLSIITWNVEWFPKNIHTINSMAEIIVELNVDIFGFQEITSTTDFIQLINKINELDTLNQWFGFRAEDGDYQELAYIINISSVNIINTPYSILNEYNHYFSYRVPYVVRVSFMNNEFIIINNHFKCCGDGNLYIDYWDEEYRRQQASILLQNYINANFSNDNVIVIGDMNDRLDDAEYDNVFQNFFQDNANFKFSDINIATGSINNYSWPGWNQNTYEAAHLDHIIISNELFDEFNNDGSNVQTICLDEYFYEYYQNISDHRPVILELVLNP